LPQGHADTLRLAYQQYGSVSIIQLHYHWDLSQKADQEHWLVASKAASDHVRFDVSVATADQFLKLLKDKSEYFRWGLLMSVPIARDSSFDGTKDKLANGEETMKVDFTEKVNLLTHWTKVPTAKCQQLQRR